MVVADQPKRCPTISEVVEELKKMTKITFPLLAMSLVNYLKNMVLVICMGRLGSLELASGSLAIGFTNITGYSILSGLAMGMDPLCSQGFGSKNFHLVQRTLKRTILLLLFASVFIALLWLNLESLMLKLHQDPEIAHLAGLYCRFAIPDLIANSFLHPLRIFLRNKGTASPLMWCSLISLVVHTPTTIILSLNLHLGLAGLAVSAFFSTFINLFSLSGYLIYMELGRDPSSTPFFLLLPESEFIDSTKQLTRKEWKMLVRFAIPGCIGICLEWWWYEIMTILAGYLHDPKTSLATAGIVIQTTSLMYTFPSSLSASVSTRVGNELGSGQPRRARMSTIVAIGLALMSSTFGLLWTTLGREKWGEIFTKDDQVLQVTMAVLPVIGLCELANCPQTTSCGVLRGSARPGVGAWVNFYSFYLVGTPVAISLAFVWELGFLGLCYGLLAAQIACLLSILVVVYRTDWDRESLKAKDLVGRDDEDVNGLIIANLDHAVIKCEEGFGNMMERDIQQKLIM